MQGSLFDRSSPIHCTRSRSSSKSRGGKPICAWAPESHAAATRGSAHEAACCLGGNTHAHTSLPCLSHRVPCCPSIGHWIGYGNSSRPWNLKSRVRDQHPRAPSGSQCIADGSRGPLHVLLLLSKAVSRTTKAMYSQCYLEHICET